jgi:actin-like protein 6A
MYCGDETGSFIGQIGSHTCRFGYGGEDNPKLVMPAHVSNKTHMATSSISSRVANQDLESILRRPDYDYDFDKTSEPLTDPNAFLRQGDSVEHWDNLQTAWETSMELLRVKDTLKHTKGGTPYSTTIQRSSTSQTASGGEGKCVHPILAITPGFTQFEGYGPNYCATVKRQQNVKYTELLMESMEASSLFLAPAPMLAAFSMGRQTALVVDVGAGGCRVTPVVDGLVLQHSQRRNGRGGDWLGHMTWKALLQQGISPKPRYQVRDALLLQPKSPLFHTWAMQDLMYELRTEPFVTVDTYNPDSRVPFTETRSTPPSPATPGSVASTAPNDANANTYELPDGTGIDLTTPFGKDLCNIPELLFAERLPFESTTTTTTTTTTTSNLQTTSNAPLHKLIRESLLAVGDVDARKDLANNILLSGGSSVFPNLEARLSYELSQTLPAFCKPKVIASRHSVERTCASWIGASVLTSLGSFQELWLSRTEYEEYGATLAIQRFP